MPAFRQIKNLTLTSMATAALVASGCVAAQAAPAAEPAAPGTFTLDILDINDFHGRIADDRDSAGAAVLAGAVDMLRAANPNTLFVSAGDNIGASTFASASQEDAPTIEALGAGGLDVSTVGNHEFDRGFEDLKGRVIDSYAKASGQDGADFALGANVYDKATGKPALKEYAIREVNGVKVGFIGTVTEDVPSLVTPTGIKDLAFGNELEAVNRVAKQLSDGDTTNGEASVIVVLTHNGSESTTCGTIAAEKTTYGELIRGASEQVDAIVSGHTHQPYNCEIAGPTGTERPVIQAHQYGTTLGKISLEVDEAGVMSPIPRPSSCPLPSRTTPETGSTPQQNRRSDRRNRNHGIGQGRQPEDRADLSRYPARRQATGIGPRRGIHAGQHRGGHPPVGHLE